MCSIHGFTIKKHTKENYKEIVKDIDEILDLLSHRGTDSYGATLISSDKLTNVKHILKKTFLEGVKETLNKHQYDFILVHARWKSIGSVTMDLQHPISTTNDTTKLIANVIHNGTTKPLYNLLDNYGKSDTAVISKVLSMYNSHTADLIKLMLQDSGVVFSVFNNGQVYVHIDKTRPLFITEHRNMISSEPFTKSNWYLIKSVDKLYDSIDDFLKNVEVYKKGIACKDKIHTRRCTECRKTHIHRDKYGKCMRCEVLEDNKEK